MIIPRGNTSRIKKLRVRWQLKLANRIYRSPGKILLSVLLLSLVAGFFTFQLFKDVRTDFATLLPENDRSVLHVKEATERMGGVMNILVSIHSPDFEANKRFAEDFAKVLKDYPKELVRFFDYNTREAEQFFKDRLFYYLTVSELKELRSTLQKRMQKTRLDALGLDLEEESDPNQGLKRVLKKIFEKYKGENPFGANRDGYFTDKTGENLAMLIRPTGDSADLQFSRTIVERLNTDIKKINPTKYHAKMEVGLAGTHVALLENFSSIIQDTVQTAALAIFLVLGSIFLYYRSMRMVVMLCIGIVVGILLTFAVTYFKIGYLNQQTAFLASIIIGNGINFGLILMARYLEERGKGTAFRRSYNRAIFYTISATAMAAFATSLSYSILSATTFRGFSQFGFIGGMGMVFCWFALNLVIPCCLVLFERLKPQSVHKIQKFIERDNALKLAQWISRHRLLLTRTMYVLVPLSVAATLLYASKDRFEYNLKKLTLKVSEGAGTENYYMRRLDKVLGNSSNASMLIAYNRTEANKTALSLEKKIADAKTQGHPLYLNSVQWLDKFYPQEQSEKFAVIRDLRRLFKPKYLSMLSPEEQKWGRVAIQALKAEPFPTRELPEMLQRIFREVDGTIGRVIFVAASQHAVLSNIQDIIKIGKEIEQSVTLAPTEKLSQGQVLFASDSMIFLDVLENVATEGPLITVLCFLAVGALIALGFRRAKDSLLVFAFLAFGMLSFIGTLFVYGIKLNFFNFITIPITIGIGVDYAINVYYRYKVDGKRSITDAVASTGSAVFLCSWTTIIGYGTMLWAKNQAMVSFGLMAVIGEISCLIFALVFLPAWLGVKESERTQKLGAQVIPTTPAAPIQKTTAPQKRTKKRSVSANRASDTKGKSVSKKKKTK